MKPSLTLLFLLLATTAHADPPGTDCRPYDADARAKCAKDPKSTACAEARNSAECCHDVCKCYGDFPAKRERCGQRRDTLDTEPFEADDSAERAQCIRDRDKCESSFCAEAMRAPQLTPGENNPKVRCERACERRSTPRCRTLLSEK